MNASKIAENLFAEALRLGMKNPITDDGLPSFAMLTNAIHDAYNHGRNDTESDEVVRLTHANDSLRATLKSLESKIHSGYDFNSDPERMTLKVFETLSVQNV